MKIIIASHFSRNSNICEYLLQKNPDFRVSLIQEESELNERRLEYLNPDWIFFPHWSKIIPSRILEKYKCVIFHMTDLPYGRGGSPLQNLIVRGHKTTKLSAIKCAEELDAGDIYLQCDLSLQGTAEEIYSRASLLMEDMVYEIITKNINPVRQSGEIVKFKRRKACESNIIDLTDVEPVFDHVRMLDAEGYPRAFIESEHLYFEFSNADLKSDDELIAEVRITKKAIKDE